MTPSTPRVVLVLSAGSAKGLAHIGVLQVLEENKIPIDYIVGCSMGAMVGGLYACGIDFIMLEKMLAHINTNSFFDVHMPRKGFIAGKKIDTFLDLLTKRKSFDQLKIPATFVATDLVSGQEILLEEGSVAEAIRASISIPGVFYPVERGNLVLVDGAVVDRFPIEIARSKGADIIIGSDVLVKLDQNQIKNVMDVIMVSLDLMQMRQYDPIYNEHEFVIKPPIAGFSSRDFHKANELIKLGRSATQAKIPEITQALRKLTNQVSPENE